VGVGVGAGVGVGGGDLGTGSWNFISPLSGLSNRIPSSICRRMKVYTRLRLAEVARIPRISVRMAFLMEYPNRSAYRYQHAPSIRAIDKP